MDRNEGYDGQVGRMETFKREKAKWITGSPTTSNSMFTRMPSTSIAFLSLLSQHNNYAHCFYNYLKLLHLN